MAGINRGFEGKSHTHINQGPSSGPGTSPTLSSTHTTSHRAELQNTRSSRPSNRRTRSNLSVSSPRTSHGRTMSCSNRQAALPLNFIIIGGSIAGLACAFELSRHGHRVKIVEKASGPIQRSGGVRVPPNLSKILLEWGLEDELIKTTARVRASTFRSITTGDTIGFLEWKEDVIKETGGDFLIMAYADLHRMIYKLAKSTGTQFMYDTTVTTVSVDEPTQIAHALLSNGEVLEADMIIGADGCASVVRDVVTDSENEGKSYGLSSFTAVVPMADLESDPELSKIAQVPEWHMWMGSNCCILGYPINAGKDFNMHLFWEDNISGPGDIDEGWDTVWPIDKVTPPKCEPRVERLLSHIPNALRTKYVQRNITEEWVDETGRIVLIGEAAHPLLPCATHNASLSVEDAVIFGTLFSHLREYDQIPLLTEAYQDLRQSRCKMVQEGELANASLLWMPTGPGTEARDKHMKLAMQAGDGGDWDEGQLRDQFETIATLFAYSARDEADDWWVNWGALHQRSQAIDPLEFRFEQTVTEVTQTVAEVQPEPIAA